LAFGFSVTLMLLKIVMLPVFNLDSQSQEIETWA